MTPAASSVTTPEGMVSTMVSSSRRRSSTARFAAVSCACALSANLPACFKIRRHVVEGTHQVVHLAGGDGGNALLILACGDLVHGVGQRLNGARDLLGQKQRQPHAEEKVEDRDEQEEEEENRANAIAGAEELPNSRPRRSGCRVVVSLSPCGMGSAATTILPDAVTAIPSAYSWPAILITGLSLLRCGVEQSSGERTVERSSHCSVPSIEARRVTELDSEGAWKLASMRVPLS